MRRAMAGSSPAMTQEGKAPDWIPVFAGRTTEAKLATARATAYKRAVRGYPVGG